MEHPSFINLTPNGFAGALDGHPFTIDNTFGVNWLDRVPGAADMRWIPTDISDAANLRVRNMLQYQLTDYLGSVSRFNLLAHYAENMGREMRGIIIGRPKVDGEIYYNDQNTHIITIGTTGYGKFVRNIAPVCLQYRGSVVVVDPKGEAAAVTARARYERHGQIPCIFDPFGKVRGMLNGNLPTHAVEVTYNPLRDIDSNSITFASDANRLAHAMITSKSDKEQFWHNNAVDLLRGLIMYVCLDDDEPRDLPQVRHYLSSTTEQWQALFLLMSRSPNKGVQDCARRMQALSRTENTFMGVVAHCNGDLFFLDDPVVRNALSENGKNLFSFEQVLSNAFLPTITEEDFAHLNCKMGDWEYKDDFLELLCCGGCSLYIVIPLEYSRSLTNLLRLMVDAFLVKSQKMQRFGPQTLFMIDEAAQLGNLEAITTAYSAGRSNNLRVWSFWQDLGQIKGCYPNEQHRSITGNAMQILLGTTDLDTAKHFSEVAGMEIKTVRSSTSRTSGRNTNESTSEGTNTGSSYGSNTGQSSSSGGSFGNGGGSWNSGSSTGHNEGHSSGTSWNSSRSSGESHSESYTDSRVVEPRIRPEEIAQGCGPATGQGLVFTGNQPLFWINTVPYYNEPMAQFADPNPYETHRR